MEDTITLHCIQLLHPLLREEILTIYQQCNHALSDKVTIRFFQTLCTFTEQNQLYAKEQIPPAVKLLAHQADTPTITMNPP